MRGYWHRRGRVRTQGHEGVLLVTLRSAQLRLVVLCVMWGLKCGVMLFGRADDERDALLESGHDQAWAML